MTIVPKIPAINIYSMLKTFSVLFRKLTPKYLFVTQESTKLLAQSIIVFIFLLQEKIEMQYPNRQRCFYSSDFTPFFKTYILSIILSKDVQMLWSLPTVSLAFKFPMCFSYKQHYLVKYSESQISLLNVQTRTSQLNNALRILEIIGLSSMMLVTIKQCQVHTYQI